MTKIVRQLSEKRRFGAQKPPRNRFFSLNMRPREKISPLGSWGLALIHLIPLTALAGTAVMLGGGLLQLVRKLSAEVACW